MDNNFDNRDFEQFVKQNADQYRMFPSEKVWKSIHHALHTRRRWYGLGLTVLLMTAGIVTWVMLSPSVRTNESLSYKPAAVSKNTPGEQKNISTPILIAASKPADNKNRFITTSDNLQENLFNASPENIPAGNIDNPENTVASETLNEPVVTSIPTVQVEMPAKPAVVYNKQMITEKPAEKTILTEVKNSNPLFSENKNAL